MKYTLLIFCLIVISSLAFSQRIMVTGISPNTGSVGTIVKITGRNFTDSTFITMGKIQELIVSRNTTSLQFMVMPGSITNSVHVINKQKIDSSAKLIIQVVDPPTDQIEKLIGTGNVSDAQIGLSVAISADNKTIALGGASDNQNYGAVWIFDKTKNNKWVQYGKKIFPKDAIGSPQFGQKLSISADGKTLIAGGFTDHKERGAVWIFAKDTSGNWVEQAKLVGSNAKGYARQGFSVAISADGNTAIEGGYADGSTETTEGKGAVWVFHRDSTNAWKQQGKLVGNGAIGNAAQGTAVAISANGNTILSGGEADSNAKGAVWVFIKHSDSTWIQDAKLTIPDQGYPVGFGFSLAVNANGNAAIIGSDDEYSLAGGAWIFVRDSISGNWFQQGNKLVGTDTTENSGRMLQGWSVSISAEGNTALSGGYESDNYQGAAWLFRRENNTWSQYGKKLVGAGTVNAFEQQGYSVCLNSEGSLALLGAPVDNESIGAGWLFGDSLFLSLKKGEDFLNSTSHVNVLSETSVDVFPNPTSTGSFSVDLTQSPFGSYSINVYNNEGAVVYKSIYNHSNEAGICPINLRNIAAGVYYVNLISAHFSCTKRIVLK